MYTWGELVIASVITGLGSVAMFSFFQRAFLYLGCH